MMMKLYPLTAILRVLQWSMLCCSGICCAGNFTLAVAPGTSLPTTVTAGGVVYACYAITNNTNIRLSNYVVTLPATNSIAVDTVGAHCPAPACSSPIALDGKASCNQQLNISGKVVNYNFAIAKGSSVTSSDNIPLNVSATTNTTAAGFAYVANSSSNTVTLCNIAANTGALSCSANTGDNFESPFGIAVNPAGTKVYVTNNGNNSITICDRVSQTGQLSGCTQTTPNCLNTPYGIAFNAAGTIAYVTNQYKVNTYRVESDGSLTFQSRVPFDRYVVGIALNPSGTRAYLTESRSSEVFMCDISQQTGDLTCPGIVAGSFDVTNGIAINGAGTHAYVTGLGSIINLCQIEELTGLFVHCSLTGGSQALPTFGIALDPTGTYAYVANTYNNSISQCEVASSGALTCLSPTPGPFDSPELLALWYPST